MKQIHLFNIFAVSAIIAIIGIIACDSEPTPPAKKELTGGSSKEKLLEPFVPRITCCSGTVETIAVDSNAFFLNSTVCEPDSVSVVPVPIPPAMRGILMVGDTVQVEFLNWEEDLLERRGNVYLLRHISGRVFHAGLFSYVEAEGIGRVKISYNAEGGSSRSNFSNYEKDLAVRLWQPPCEIPQVRLLGEMR